MDQKTGSQLPELGTKAAAVAAIESLIFRAIGAKDLEPLQLRYWLDAYYQARLAQELELGPEVSIPPEIQVDQFGYETPGAESGPEDAAETQQKTEPAAKPQRMRPVGWSDGKQLPTDPETYSGAAAAAKFKREQFERLQRFLREGVTMQTIVKAADGNITEDQILGIRECRRVPVAVYRVLEAALDRIETD